MLGPLNFWINQAVCEKHDEAVDFDSNLVQNNDLSTTTTTTTTATTTATTTTIIITTKNNDDNNNENNNINLHIIYASVTQHLQTMKQ